MFFAKLEACVLDVVAAECVVNIPKLIRLIGKKMKMVGPVEIRLVIDRMVESGKLANVATFQNMEFYTITESGSEEVYRRRVKK